MEREQRKPMEDEEEEEFMRQWDKRQEKLRGIIAMKGLPFTLKTDIAMCLGEWAKCPSLCIQDFFIDQGEPLLDAFTRLCRVAKRHLSKGFVASSTVVIKSRLSSTFELEQLLHLTSPFSLTPSSKSTKYPLLIIECRMGNEYPWKLRVDEYGEQGGLEEDRWYSRPRSWKDMEVTILDFAAQSSGWDLHLRHLLESTHQDDHDHTIVRRLVVDPFNDLFFAPVESFLGVPNAFFDCIKYLLTTDQSEVNDLNPFEVEFDALRLFLLEKKLSEAALKGRHKHLCPRGGCVFRALNEDEEVSSIGFCWVCEEQVLGPAYTCYLCVLTLHKSCAERIDFEALQLNIEFLYLKVYYHDKLLERHPCKSCTDEGRSFSRECGTCLLQTHLKCGLIPTIINHNCHRHFLSLLLIFQDYFCKACRRFASGYSYCCKKCAVYYHLECAFLPLKVLRHKHGGHQHVMKLLCSRAGLEQEEDYWCDFCYEDMDPQAWFYSCQSCPYYTAHVHCSDGYKCFTNPKDEAILIRQLQSQLEDAMAEKTNS